MTILCTLCGRDLLEHEPAVRPGPGWGFVHEPCFQAWDDEDDIRGREVAAFDRPVLLPEEVHP